MKTYQFQYIIILLTSLLITSCELETVPSQPIPTFKKTIGDESTQTATDVIQIPNTEEYLIVGQGGSGCLNGYIVKIDANGNIINQEDGFGAENDNIIDLFTSVEISSEGNILAVGWSIEAPSTACDWWTIDNPDSRIFFAEISPSLNVNPDKMKTFSSDGLASRWDAGYGVTEVAGTYIITGSWGVKPAFIKISAADINATPEEIPILGNGVWIGEAKAAFSNTSGEIVLTGKGTNNLTQSLFAIVKSNGEIDVDYQTPQLRNQAEGQSLVQTSDGGYMIVGMAFDTPDNSNFSGLFSEDVALYICKYDANGEFVNNKLWIPENNARAGALDIIKFEDDYLISGFSYENGVRELLILKIDEQGEEVWHETYRMGENNTQHGAAIIATTDGGILVVGETNGGQTDMFVIKTNREGKLLQ